jgi:hypothetical protein
MRQGKYEYRKVIQQNHNGKRWEDVSEYKADSSGNILEISDQVTPKGRRKTLLAEDLKGYLELGYPTRIVFRKTKIK